MQYDGGKATANSSWLEHCMSTLLKQKKQRGLMLDASEKSQIHSIYRSLQNWQLLMVYRILDTQILTQDVDLTDVEFQKNDHIVTTD